MTQFIIYAIYSILFAQEITSDYLPVNASWPLACQFCPVTHLRGPRTAKPWVTDAFFIVTVFLWHNGGRSSITLRGCRHRACQRRGGGCVLERVLEPCRL